LTAVFEVCDVPTAAFEREASRRDFFDVVCFATAWANGERRVGELLHVLTKMAAIGTSVFVNRHGLNSATRF
jgi:hypothetical protein